MCMTCYQLFISENLYVKGILRVRMDYRLSRDGREEQCSVHNWNIKNEREIVSLLIVGVELKAIWF